MDDSNATDELLGSGNLTAPELNSTQANGTEGNPGGREHVNTTSGNCQNVTSATAGCITEHENTEASNLDSIDVGTSCDPEKDQ